MQTRQFTSIWLLLLLALTIAATGSGVQTASAAELSVVATIHPLGSITQAVGGSLVSVHTILPPGASPHTFEPRPAHVRSIADSRIFVAVGEGLDDWALTLARSAGRADVLLISERVKAAGLARAFDEHEDDSHEHGDIDPHVWLDPIIVKEVIAPAIAEALIAALPEHRNEIRQNLDRFRGELTQLDAWIRERLADSEDAAFISYHSAWGYFAHRYGLHHVASVAGFPGQEPSARWIAQIVQMARRQGVRVIFAEPQLSPKAAQTIAREIRGEVLLLDPIGGPGLAGRDSYIDLMRYNTEMLAQAFALAR